MIETRIGVPMDNEALSKYLRNLVNLFFKILPIRENGDKTLVTYMQSLQAELLGCSKLVVSLDSDPAFVTLLSILQFLIDNPESEQHVFKREVFKAISICNKLKARYVESALRKEG